MRFAGILVIGGLVDVVRAHACTILCHGTVWSGIVVGARWGWYAGKAKQSKAALFGSASLSPPQWADAPTVESSPVLAEFEYRPTQPIPQLDQ